MIFEVTSLEIFCPTITYDFRVKYLRDTQLVDILIISFHGNYRNGSAGAPDAGLITGIVKTGASVFDPFFVVIDLSDLEYTWGDNFNLDFEEVEPTKTVVVVGDRCRRAMSTLAFGMETQKDIVDNEFFFDDIEKALARLSQEKLTN